MILITFFEINKNRRSSVHRKFTLTLFHIEHLVSTNTTYTTPTSSTNPTTPPSTCLELLPGAHSATGQNMAVLELLINFSIPSPVAFKAEIVYFDEITKLKEDMKALFHKKVTQ